MKERLKQIKDLKVKITMTVCIYKLLKRLEIFTHFSLIKGLFRWLIKLKTIFHNRFNGFYLANYLSVTNIK